MVYESARCEQTPYVPQFVESRLFSGLIRPLAAHPSRLADGLFAFTQELTMT